MNLEVLARAAGAAFFARATVNHTAGLTKMIERALGVSGFAMVEVISNCHVLYGKMNELGDAAEMMQSMDRTTRRINPVLLRRAERPLRLTWPGAPSWSVDAPPLEGIAEDDRTPRGVIFERKGSVDFGQRYYAMLEEIKARREK
jgi:pyruvate/2-oxoacid:ferredoxin oxidoreductase beta subunit